VAISVLNTDAGLSATTLVNAESAQTVTGLKTFDRDPNPPFAVSASSAVVTNLDADKLDGQEGSYYTNASNLASGTVPAARLSAANGASLVLLHANSGTNTSAAAANVDTIAISGLTAKDTLVIELSLASVTQTTATPLIYNSTDSVSITDIRPASGSFTAGLVRIATVHIRQMQSAATTVCANSMTLDGMTGNNATFTTNWTGSWTLALRHGGVTAGGTFQWSWAVYKIAGQ
jgi:hypothetical protein